MLFVTVKYLEYTKKALLKIEGLKSLKTTNLVKRTQISFLIQKELLRFHFWMDMWRIIDFIYKIVK